jgi:hypothetical protein
MKSTSLKLGLLTSLTLLIACGKTSAPVDLNGFNKSIINSLKPQQPTVTPKTTYYQCQAKDPLTEKEEQLFIAMTPNLRAPMYIDNDTGTAKISLNDKALGDFKFYISNDEILFSYEQVVLKDQIDDQHSVHTIEALEVKLNKKSLVGTIVTADYKDSVSVLRGSQRFLRYGEELVGELSNCAEVIK